MRVIRLVSGFGGFQCPVVDESAGVDGLPDPFLLGLIGVKAVPEGFEHTFFLSNGIFEVRDSSPP